MFTIFKKEVRSYFRRGSAYFFLATALLFVGLLSSAFNLYLESSQMEIILPNVSIIIAVILPIFIMNIFSRERKNGTDKLLYSLPFKTSDIFFGKFLAVLLFFCIITAAISLLPLLFGLLGTVNYLSSYLTLVCFLMFGVTIIAFCTFIAAVIKKKVLSVIITYVSLIASFLLYLTPVGASDGIWKTTANALRFLSPFAHVNEFYSGAFKINSIIYFILFTALFIILTVCSLSKERTVASYGKKAPQAKRFVLTPVFAIILSICTVMASASLSLLPHRLSSFDITSNKSLTLSDATKDFLASLECDVDIYVINSDGSAKQFETFVELYDEHSDKLNVKFVAADDIAEKLITLGWDGQSELDPYLVLIESANGGIQMFFPNSSYFYQHPMFGIMDENQYYQYYQLLYQYAQSDPATYGEALTSFVNETKLYSTEEAQLTSCIEYTTLDIIPTAYYVTGHGEPSADTSTLYYLLESAEFGTLDLSAIEKLPEDASCLVINAPANDLSDNETTLIKEFLANGGALTLITNEANLDMPNLMSIVTYYGVSASKGFVSFDYEAAAEEDAEQTEAETTDGQETSTEEESIDEETTALDKNLVVSQVSVSHASLANLAGYSAQALRANHIDISDNLRETLTVTPLLTTSEECFIDGVENSTGAKTVAVVIEETVDGVTTQITWYTGAESFDGDQMQTINAYAVAYSAIWSIDQPSSELGEIAPRLIDNNYIEISSTTRLVLLALMIAIVPSALIVTGCIANSKYKKKTTKKKKDVEPQDSEPDADIEENTQE